MVDLLHWIVSSAIHGWIMLGLLLAVFTFAYWKLRQKQEEANLHPRHFTIGYAGFPVTTIPTDYGIPAGERLCQHLKDIKDDCWNHFDNIYDKIRESPKNPIHSLRLQHHPTYKGKYKMIRLHLQAGICIADIDHRDLDYLWAAELHNAYRYQIYGMARVYQGDYMTTADRERYRRALLVVKSFKKES